MTENRELDDIFFTKRGEVEEFLTIDGTKYGITIKKLDNLESDKLVEKFTNIDEMSGSASVQMSELAEERLLTTILDAPFSCRGTPWKEASPDNKRHALRELKPEIRKTIIELCIGHSSVSQEEEGFLSKQSEEDSSTQK